jgi:small conductance mechanosensitive channel
VEYTIGVSYGEDPRKVREIILGVLLASPYSLVHPEPEVNVSAIADDRLVLTVYFWTPSRSYTAARPAVLEGIQKDLVGSGIEIPPPRHHVSLTGGEEPKGSPAGDEIRRVL